MSETKDAVSYQKATALVYTGAAFLILIVGFRAIAMTGLNFGFGENFLNTISIIALVLEFCLLLYYASVIRNAPEGGGDGGGATGDLAEVLATLKSIADDLKGIVDVEQRRRVSTEIADALYKTAENIKTSAR